MASEVPQLLHVTPFSPYYILCGKSSFTFLAASTRLLGVGIWSYSPVFKTQHKTGLRQEPRSVCEGSEYIAPVRAVSKGGASAPARPLDPKHDHNSFYSRLFTNKSQYAELCFRERGKRIIQV